MANDDNGGKQIDSLRHQDQRTNIPTNELRGFVATDEQQPSTMLYPRNPDLDPQLVWQGKDEQDREPLAVPTVPIYIQEKIHPQAIIEDIRAELRDGDTSEQLGLFDDFNGIDFAEQIEFYQHEQHWSNRMILGDSLLVMNSLAEKEGLRGKVQVVYIDPPYGIRFNSNWQVSTRQREVQDGKADHATRQPEQIRAFRDTWRHGIHSYLSYLRDRLVVARDLLADTGSVFVQIGDENVHIVRSLLDEVFGEANFMSLITFKKTAGATGEYLAGTNDYVLWYARQRDAVKYRPLYRLKALGEQGAGAYTLVEMLDGRRRRMTSDERGAPTLLPDSARPFAHDNLTSQSIGRQKGEGAASWFDVVFEGSTYRPSMQSRWKTNSEGMRRLHRARRLGTSGNTLWYVRYIDDFPAFPLTNSWDDTVSSFMSDKVYVVQTNAKVVERCLLMATDPGDLALDPTCGSGTTAYVAEQWGRRWITIDTSRVALALARTRLMSARHPYYILADSTEGRLLESKATGVPPAASRPGGDIRQGFAYKRAPHIKLSDISRNEEIDTIWERWQERLEPLRAEVNTAAGQAWEEWQLPRPDEASGLSATALSKLRQWWQLRRERQQEIDESIARHSEQEILYDQPYEDNKILRVTGPFTVESLSPHRMLSTDEERPESEGEVARGAGDRFETMILDNLRKAGVQNTVRDERLVFDRLEPFAGQWIHAEGEFTDKDEQVRRVAVHIGPEHGTVGPNDIKEAAKEAVQGIGFNILVICGFAFDPHVYEECQRYPRPQVLPCKMNPDLAMGDELLKKTGAGNLFMVFGEPDIEMRHRADGDIEVEINGLDVYDPTTGQIRNSSTADIACWFIDTAYNGEAFFVRHAYFTGGDKPYEQLARALRAEINEDAWSALYTTVSRPFPVPESGKIAVKVINHYGDEVLKVYEVG